MGLGRLKVVLLKRKKTDKRPVEVLGKNEASDSLWCSNLSQPSLEILFAIAKALVVDVRVLLVNTKDK
ncbi:MAG: transcriptional regulator [Bacteroidia bacterium 44-10]|nr:MAG: transcriptional regulator [Bacteroidia bacterium 44-10]